MHTLILNPPDGKEVTEEQFYATTVAGFSQSIVTRGRSFVLRIHNALVPNVETWAKNNGWGCEGEEGVSEASDDASSEEDPLLKDARGKYDNRKEVKKHIGSSKTVPERAAAILY
ncbi:hypothetical protein HK104_008408 [Borealophlyctis nickersoniae]|nr:hypothetical protein HK104_008408 [Borealophlyctis nickersoniae]